jgi:hypothetical protein
MWYFLHDINKDKYPYSFSTGKRYDKIISEIFSTVSCESDFEQFKHDPNGWQFLCDLTNPRNEQQILYALDKSENLSDVREKFEYVKSNPEVITM